MAKYPIVMIMGVAGAGKTTIAQSLAHAMDAAFIDADDFHPKENIDHMKSGKPLTDAMRWSWLDAVGDAVKQSASSQQVVFACSALKRIYRDYLRAGLRYHLVYPDAPIDVVTARIGARKGHFMPAKLIRSQYVTLDVPTKDETPIVIDITQSLPEIVRMILIELDARA